LALACSGRARHALARYRQRWTIETMFGNLKTKGFALESTHLTNPDKLCTLLALLAFAVALSVKTGAARARLHAIPIKNNYAIRVRPAQYDLRSAARERSGITLLALSRRTGAGLWNLTLILYLNE
jgi:hypothetical protein